MMLYVYGKIKIRFSSDILANENPNTSFGRIDNNSNRSIGVELYGSDDTIVLLTFGHSIKYNIFYIDHYGRDQHSIITGVDADGHFLDEDGNPSIFPENCVFIRIET